jgi:hypothetical protein
LFQPSQSSRIKLTADSYISVIILSSVVQLRTTKQLMIGTWTGNKICG